MFRYRKTAKTVFRKIWCEKLNKYRDNKLDNAGVVLLDEIITASSKQPVEALTQLDRLIQMYPESPQLWVSKSIITPATYINERR